MQCTQRARRLALALVLLTGSSMAAAAATHTIGRGPVGGLADLGVSGSDRTVKIAVMLKFRNEGDLLRLIAEQQRRGSALYHRFLTSAEFNAMYAPDEAALSRVADALRQGGFTVTQSWSNRTVIDAEAPAPVAARFFSTTIHEYAQPGVGRQYANATPAVVPASIAADVRGVVGLSNVRAWSTHWMRGQRQAPPADAGTLLSGPAFAPDGGYGPQIYTVDYNMLSLQGYDGTGRTAAIVIDADFLDSDVAGFDSYFGVTRTGTISRRLVDGGPPPGLSTDSEETQLDVATIASLSPGANVIVYEGVDFNDPANLIDAYNAVLSDNVAEVVNASLGYCETAFGDFPQMVDEIGIQAAALGITLNASTGDNGTRTYSGGKAGCNQRAVDVPAAAPHTTAVGGTTLRVYKHGRLTGQFKDERDWATTEPHFLGATGGGVSTIFPLPDFQSGVSGVIPTGRNSPDNSYDADPNTGEGFYYSGVWQGPIGGTSLASPIFSANILQLNQKNGSRSGWFNPTLYSGWETGGYGDDWRDITEGRPIGNQYFPKVGYDNTTGIGVTLFGAAAGLLP